MANTTTVIPYIRSKEVLFVANNLKPDKAAHFFFDDTNVDNFVQKSSKIVLTAGYLASAYTQSEGLYCSTTRGYATVIATSPIYGRNTIYVNDNYTSLNVAAIGANTFSSTDFNYGDIIYSSPNGAISSNTFSARVEFFKFSDGILVVKPINGTASNVGTARFLYNLGNGKSANITSLVFNTKFNSGNMVVSTKTGSFFTVASYEHNHGVVPRTNATSTVLCLASPPPSTALGNTVYVTSGSGLGQSARVNTINGSNLVLDTAITGITGNTTYSLGVSYVDEQGTIAGIYQLPETNTYKFRTGERVFTITDTLNKNDPDNQMLATSKFVASGILESFDKMTPVVPPAPVSPPQNRFTTPSTPSPIANIPNSGKGRLRDPVAQTFFTPQPNTNKTDYGIFVSSIDLFFKNKPNRVTNDIQLPVTVKIVTTSNGYPTESVLAAITIPCENVNITDGITTFPSSSNATTLTKFSFSNPVYLSPNQEYAIVVYSDSPSYEVWVAELGQTVIGDPNKRRVSEQPYIGSFFRSQNASTWTPFQNEDMMFVINKAVFSSGSQSSLLFNVVPPISNVGIHNMMLHSSDITFPNTTLQYAFRSTLARTQVMDSVFTAIERDKIYNFSSDLKTSSVTTNRKREIFAGNANSMFIEVTVGTNDSDISPMFNSERLSLITEEYLINDCGIYNENITLLSGGNYSNVANVIVTISAPQLPLGTTATAYAINTVPNVVSAIIVTNPGSGYVESPTITISGAGTSNATAVIISEDGTSGGNALARYLTKKIVLADGFDAGDLRVYVDAIRPQGTNVVAYYKVLSGSDPDSFDNKKWKRMYLQSNNISPDTLTPVELIFRPDETSTKLFYIENGVTYPLGGNFKYFAIKLVMTAADPSVPPIIQNMRATALPAG
jgi:hypothetical protein